MTILPKFYNMSRPHPRNDKGSLRAPTVSSSSAVDRRLVRQTL